MATLTHGQHREEGVEHHGVEVRPSPGSHDLDRILLRQGGAVGAVPGQSFEDVRRSAMPSLRAAASSSTMRRLGITQET